MFFFSLSFSLSFFFLSLSPFCLSLSLSLFTFSQFPLTDFISPFPQLLSPPHPPNPPLKSQRQPHLRWVSALPADTNNPSQPASLSPPLPTVWLPNNCQVYELRNVVILSHIAGLGVLCQVYTLAGEHTHTYVRTNERTRWDGGGGRRMQLRTHTHLQTHTGTLTHTDGNTSFLFQFSFCLFLVFLYF